MVNIGRKAASSDMAEQNKSDRILDALIRRSYERPLQTAQNLAVKTNISSYTRMAMLFQACRSSSAVFLTTLVCPTKVP